MSLLIEQSVFDDVYRTFRKFNAEKPLSVPAKYGDSITIDEVDKETCLIFHNLRFVDIDFDLKEYGGIMFDDCYFDNVTFRSNFDSVRFDECKFNNCGSYTITIRDSKFRDNIFKYCDLNLALKNCDLDLNSFIHSNIMAVFDSINSCYSDEHKLLQSNFEFSCVNLLKCKNLQIESVTAYYSSIKISNCCELTDINLDTSYINISNNDESTDPSGILFTINADNSRVEIYLPETDEKLINPDSCINNIDSRITGDDLSQFINPIIKTDRIGSRKSRTLYYVKYNWVVCGCWSKINKEDKLPPMVERGGSLEDFEERVLSVYPANTEFEKERNYCKQYMNAIAQFKKARKDYLESIEKEA